jgi:hypothetical protein
LLPVPGLAGVAGCRAVFRKLITCAAQARGAVARPGLRQAQARFANLIHGAWLATASAAAYDQALTRLLRVGPAGLAATKLIQVSLLDPAYRGDVMTVGLRWEATGAAGSLFPVLDANITISPAQREGTAGDEDVARLALTGSYRPPLGHLGAVLDQVVLHRVATATIRALLQNVAGVLTGPAPAEHPAKDVRAGLTAVPDLDTP